MLDRAAVDALFPSDLPNPEHWEQHYPQRQLPDGAAAALCRSSSSAAQIAPPQALRDPRPLHGDVLPDPCPTTDR